MDSADRDEWAAAQSRAKANPRWSQMTPETRTEYVTTLMSPFVLTEEKMALFIKEASSATEG
jgi:hypothetical protein